MGVPRGPEARGGSPFPPRRSSSARQSPVAVYQSLLMGAAISRRQNLDESSGREARLKPVANPKFPRLKGPLPDLWTRFYRVRENE